MEHCVKIEESLYQTYSQIRLGILTFDAEVQPSDDAFWNHMNDTILPNVREKMEGKEWGQLEGVGGSRAAYKAFGRNPGRYRVSSEALLRRVKRGDELYHINSVVDVNNLISVESGLSVGSYDLDQIKGDVILRKAEAGEGYKGIGKEDIDMENMLVLVDEEGLFGSSMSDSTRAMVREETKKVMVVIYCFEDAIDLEALLARSKEAFATYAGIKEIQSWII